MNFKANSNPLAKELKKLKLDELLLLLANQSKDLFQNNTAIKFLELTRRIGTLSGKMFQPLTAWNLADLSYLAILNSNDYRSKSPYENDIYILNNLLARISNEDAPKKSKDVEKKDIKANLLFGLSQKQFSYQDTFKTIYYNFLRYYTLLNEMPKLLPQYKLPKDDLLEIAGFDIDDFSRLLLAGISFIQAPESSSISFKVPDDLQSLAPILTTENLQKCLNFFIGDYSYYRNVPIKPNVNPLYFRPIVRTSTAKIIISNAFIWARKFYEGIYWIIRNKYQQIGSQDFINHFGEYYENYIEQLLGYYLKSYQYTKIKRFADKKSADWRIETSNYLLIIEQKSCLMNIELKEEFPSLEKLDEFLARNFKKAYEQINTTITGISKNKKPIIKLILHFEKLYFAEAIIKERVNKMCEGTIEDLSYYFFIDTEEFERLMQCLSEDEASFDTIIKTKCEYEEKGPPPGTGLAFQDIIRRYSKFNINFLLKYKYVFDGLFPNLEE